MHISSSLTWIYGTVLSCKLEIKKNIHRKYYFSVELSCAYSDSATLKQTRPSMSYKNLKGNLEINF
jgi:hypothetical protein